MARKPAQKVARKDQSTDELVDEVIAADDARKRRGKRGKTWTRADHEARARQAYWYRLRGWTYRDIADVLGYADPRGAHQAVQRYMDVDERDKPDVGADRQMLRERYGQYLFEAEQWAATVSARVAEGDLDVSFSDLVKLWDHRLRINDHIRELDALDAPKQVQPAGDVNTVNIAVFTPEREADWADGVRRVIGEVVGESDEAYRTVKALPVGES